MVVATAAAQAVERVGLPEARLIMAEAALYIALAPKSNAVMMGIKEAMKAVEEEAATAVPEHLRDVSYFKLEKLSGNKGVNEYKYPHDYPGNYVRQQYLPEHLLGREFYKPSGSGNEED